MGRYDLVRRAVEELGGIDFWKVAMKPGKPCVLGRVGNVPFLGLPGNPVSVHVSFEQFVRPAIRKMKGARGYLRPTINARLTETLEHGPGRFELVRVRLSKEDGEWLASPTGAQGSHIQSSLVDTAWRGSFRSGRNQTCGGHPGHRRGLATSGGGVSMSEHPETRARMVDVTGKEITTREATAEAFIRMSPATLDLVMTHKLEKGDALEVARIAGLMAAKKTAELIPLCHPISLGAVEVSFTAETDGVRVHALARTNERTGVEMEALTAATVTALTIYDMVKGTERGVEITGVRLLSKSGGRSGDWERPPNA